MGTEVELKEYKHVLNQRFGPFTSSHLLNSATQPELIKLAPFLEGYKQIEDKTTVFICENHTCRPPLTEIEEFKNIINP